MCKATGKLEASTSLAVQNPFIPRPNEQSGHWMKPRISLRRQADLVKKARAAGLVHLLPPGPKLGQTEGEVEEAGSSRYNVEEGPTIGWAGEWHVRKVAGADIGARLYAGKKRMFKGHKWQRELRKRQAAIGVRLRDMEKRVHRWRMVSFVAQV
ncbi:hypothetical protein SISSUDRAFT_987595 [Sistotremastrum suecicum HHB10207 ss-3]|uniref:Large ribosomal subunit protein mL59 domain-containing protein n=1 Tax=Sistotremastrum suecicum HHB10207 ss-3 TaxID=1314776 RepID=A0A166CGZ9_9AGAM|nr:hypothetical protein SISSUDRAFT_987595 [Sistotremastrum suecicum HHB10207 ss-3]